MTRKEVEETSHQRLDEASFCAAIYNNDGTPQLGKTNSI